MMRVSWKIGLLLFAVVGGLAVVANRWWFTAPPTGAEPGRGRSAAAAVTAAGGAPLGEAEFTDHLAPDRPWEIAALPPEIRAQVEAVRATAGSVTVVRLNPAVLAGKASPLLRPGVGVLTLILPEGGEVTARVERTTLPGPGPDMRLSEGRIAEVPGARWRLAVVRGRVSASIDGLPGGEVKVRTIETAVGPVAQLYRVDPARAGNCVVVPAAERPAVAGDAATTGFEAEAFPHAVAAEALGSGDAVIDLLLVYTSAVRTALGGAAALEAEAVLAVAQVNGDFAASGITARIRLADTLEVSLPNDHLTSLASGWQRTALENLTGMTDGIMDEVHAAREAAGADLVTLVVQRPDSQSAGLAYILERVGHYSESYFAFSVLNADVLSDAATLSHELGHNLGCAHDRDNAGALPDRGHHGAFPGAYGFKTTATDTNGVPRQVSTIMAYPSSSRVRLFSSPDNAVSETVRGGQTVRFPQPVPLGVAVADDPGNAADNVSVINRTAFQVAGYRLAPARSFAGRLVNVSTRAYVGSGYRTLTGGFVVAGTAAKRVLVRAPGPTLAADYGVPGALADPVVHVNRLLDDGTARRMGENDDWGWPAVNGTATAAAGVAVGAFDFRAGSKDAAVVVDLEPGAYTAEVTGAGGAEGVALIEAYDVNGATAAARLLNLSTRGYASTEHPMVAGFVVERETGAENERKTMFLRVRGPSLANYGLPADEVMPDPRIEIFDAAARLIYVNDDWDSPSAILDASIPPLQRGQVDQPAEAAVYAAAQSIGDAVVDMLPVEPGVVIELPPGLYTMFVRPFTDGADPVGEPGVAIVEVFELSR